MTNAVRIDPPPFVIDRSLPAMKAWQKLPEGVRAEVINGKLYVLASPTTYHALVLTDIFSELASYVRTNHLGFTFGAPVDVYLFSGADVVVPDIVFVSNENKHKIRPNGIHSAPDLHIEILSPGTKRRDLLIKKNLYEQAGVHEYWIIDPVTKNAQGYLFKDGKYGDPLLTNSEIYVRILKKRFSF